MNVKCDSLRAAVMHKVEGGVPYRQIHKELGVHPNTIVKYVRQSKALMPAAEDLRGCLSRLAVPEGIAWVAPEGSKEGSAPEATLICGSGKLRGGSTITRARRLTRVIL